MGQKATLRVDLAMSNALVKKMIPATPSPPSGRAFQSLL
jgi:hypothetical protein